MGKERAVIMLDSDSLGCISLMNAQTPETLRDFSWLVHAAAKVESYSTFIAKRY
jgi:hypothetical protein